VKYFSFKRPNLKGLRNTTYFSVKEIRKIWESARLLDEEWALWQAGNATKIINQFVPTKANHCTGVRGVTMMWKYKNKRGKKYWSFMFSWSGMNASRIKASRSVTIKGDGQDAWIKVIAAMGKEKKLGIDTVNDLMTRCPSKRKINKLKLSLTRNENA
jgi:hypothetical protein